MVVYAHWKKGGNNNQAIDSKLVGAWYYSYYTYIFDTNGKFTYLDIDGSRCSEITGKYSTSNGNIYVTNMVYAETGTKLMKDRQYKYSFGKDKDGEFLLTPPFNSNDLSPTYTNPLKFRKSS